MKPTPIRLLALAASAAALCALQGCNSGHGQHTSQALADAQDRLGALKAGSEYEMAQQQFLAGDLDKALKSVDKCIGYSPSVAKAYVLRGRVLLEQGRLEDAKTALDKALAIDPAHADALYFSGVVLERFSEYETAHARYLAAAEADSANAQYVVAAAEMLVELDRLEEAQALLESRRAVFEHNAGLRQALGHVATLRADYDGAVLLFGEARVLAPDDLSILEDLVRAQVHARRFAEAEANLGRLLNADTAGARRDLRRLQAECLAGQGRHSEARAVYLGLTAGAEGASDATAWIGLGRAAMALQDFARVRIAANRAIALAPTRPEGRLLLAACRRESGDLPGALALTDEAAALAPDDPACWIFRAVVLRKMGRADEASQSLATALRIDPSNDSARSLLAAAETQD